MDLPMDRASLERAVAEGAPFEYLLFWGHTPGPGPDPGPECLSQWWEVDFEVDGVAYPSAEHYMMAEKARLFEDEEALAQILAAAHPGEAKKWGRKVRGFEDETWRAHREAIVTRGNVAKFGQHEDLGAYLESTHPRVLVEASPRDRIWGIGLGAKNEHARDPRQWRGSNLLGFALLRARAELMER